ncbi:cbb3-type cytochrome c oxidase N-terminal domain-containing protein [Seleniivibrio woodruffii]|uniref:cbb3-type cytochrome c oxidase N-terminal domain-containing protein n=1 Tax=Seleniivibrio woodruffii TaxID=1078050 RepID=UPI0026F20A7B|nr:cbb3-type cytochrome c oxidase N-terminal domain-containing protein [Seleniivibrio woodruffii]
MQEEFDNLEEFTREDTENALPLGWLILFIGLIVFGIYYVYAYTPAFTGWSQEKALQESMQTQPK